MIGTSLNQYRIAAPLGAGGMGEVFRARDTRLNRDVAVKVLPSDWATDADRLRRFEQEARALAALNHPNLLTVHDTGVYEGAPYLVSELLEGRTLREELAGGALPARKATEYALQIANGLAAAHDRGVIHRDLKPENIFVTREGRVKILDFGLAKLRDTPESEARGANRADPEAPTVTQGKVNEATEPGRVLGTPSYMSPEQVRGEVVDQRTDLFSFGCVLCEMVSGQRPFKRATSVDTMAAILKEEPPDLSATRVELSPGLVRIVYRCLEKQPENRFQSAKDLAFALETLTDSGVARARDRGMATRQRSACDSTSWTAWWVGAALAVAVLGITVYLVVDWRNRPSALVPREPGLARPGGTVTNRHRLAVLPLVNISPDPNDAYFADGMTEELISTLANVRELEVIARTSVMPYRDTTKNIAQIGRELSVSTVLEGSVRKSGNQLRITIKLIDVATQARLLSRDFNRELKDVFAIQAEVAQQVAETLKITLGVAEQRQLVLKPTDNVDAYSLYLLARHQFSQFTPGGMSNCLSYLNQAINLEPNFALAHAGRLHAYTAIASFGFERSLEVWPKAAEAAQTALRLDSQLVDLRTGLGAYALMFTWKWDDALRELELAISLRPSDRDAHELYGVLLGNLGRIAESQAQILRAHELDPLSHNTLANLGFGYVALHEYDRAVQHGQQAVRLKPGFDRGHYVIALALIQQQHFSEAAAEVTRCDHFETSPFLLSVLGYAYAAWGKTNEARGVLEKLQRLSQQLPYVPPVQEARIHLVLRDEETTFRLLNRAYDERDGSFPSLRFEPPFDRLRSDPRFVALLQKAGLPND